MILLSLLLAAAQPAAAFLPVNVGGRVADEGAAGKRFGWPGVYFEGRFRGTAVEVEVDPGTDFLRLSVDGEEKAVVKGAGRRSVRVEGLRPGEHVVRLEKLTESQTGGGRFFGFRAFGGRALPPAPKPRRIEFVGDSYTVGYGNASPGRSCTREEVHDLTDTQRAFGPLLAKRLGADYRIVAYSGFGIVRNYNGSRAGESLPGLYPRLVPEDPSRVTARSDPWRPQLIVVNLGTNDFSTPLHAGERWRDEAALRADYRRRYTAFAGELLERHKQARLILMASDAFLADVRQVAAAVNSASPRRATVLHFGELELTGCDWHPSLADHRRLADSLAAAVAARPDLWRTSGGRRPR